MSDAPDPRTPLIDEIGTPPRTCRVCGSWAEGDLCVSCAVDRAESIDACAFGSPTCPCQDGDPCHYVDLPGSPAMAPPATQTASKEPTDG